jgi:uncharacterized membrane protein
MYDVSLFVLYMTCYSFLGWVAEVIYVFLTEHRWENRGFLVGPFLPIYGIGAIALLLFVLPYVDNPFLVFIASVAVTSTIEYAASLLLDKVFHISLWDYHDRPFNLQGRICLQNSLAFGGLGLLLLYVIHPFLNAHLNVLSHAVTITIAWVLLGILILDSANSLRSLAKVRPVIDSTAATLGEVHSLLSGPSARETDAADSTPIPSDSIHVATVGRLAKVFPRARSARTTSGSATQAERINRAN